MTIKVGDEIRYKGQSMNDLTHNKIYKAFGVYPWGFTVLGDTGLAREMTSQNYERIPSRTIKVGEEVRYTGHSMFDLTQGKVYEVICAYEGGFEVLDDVGDTNSVASESYELVDDAPALPPIWDDMTDAEKGAILLAKHEGRKIEGLTVLSGWVSYQGPIADHGIYRVAEPVVETVTLRGQRYTSKTYPNGVWDFGRNEEQCEDTHRITFNTIDGKPDLDSVKMEEL